MTCMLYSQVIHQLYGDKNKFKIHFANIVCCTASDCGKVMKEIEELAGPELTIGLRTTVIRTTVDFNDI